MGGQHPTVYVVELADTAGPRRRADRPNLYVGQTVLDPTERFERDQAAGSTNHVVRDHGVRLRPDLAAAPDPEAGDRAMSPKRRLIRELRRQGFTLNGEQTTWRLYVIELSDDVGTRAEPALPWVYVGQSTLEPEARFRQHRDGARKRNGQPLFSRVVHRHGLRLRPDLYEDEPVRYTLDDALDAERLLAARLAAAGYSVRGGT